MAKLDNKDYRVYCICGDGEIEEGQIWEAAMAAAHYGLDNLVAIVDWNGLQIDGKNEDVITVTPIDEKFASFGWDVTVIDGHDFEEIAAAVEKAKKTEGKPQAIIAKTVKGKGVSFMENNVDWHGKGPNDAEYAAAMEELEKAGEALCQK